MTVLVGHRLMKRMLEPIPRDRLVIGPLLQPAEQFSQTQASVDVRLGFSFRLAAAANIGVLDEFAESPMDSFGELKSLYQHIYVPLGGSVTIHPHQLILALTLEYLRLPTDLMAYVVGRSSLGRLGLIIATAIGVHPSFCGPLTLELRNLGEAPVRLYPGMTIAQLFFHELAAGDDSAPMWPGISEEVGQFAIATENPIPRHITSKQTAKKLQKLRRRQMKAQRILREL